VDVELRTSQLNKKHIEMSFENIISNFTNKFNDNQAQIEELKLNFAELRQPLVEYSDYLSKEVHHLDRQQYKFKETTSALLEEFKSVCKQKDHMDFTSYPRKENSKLIKKLDEIQRFGKTTPKLVNLNKNLTNDALLFESKNEKNEKDQFKFKNKNLNDLMQLNELKNKVYTPNPTRVKTESSM